MCKPRANGILNDQDLVSERLGVVFANVEWTTLSMICTSLTWGCSEPCSASSDLKVWKWTERLLT